MASDSDNVIKVVGKCKLNRKLGEGGMGVVYRGYHEDLDLEVAVKLLPANLAEREGMAERFLREARLAARINCAEAVRVLDCGQEGDQYYLVMEYVEGESVLDLIRKMGPLPIGKALEIARSTATALREALDQVGIIHRDIKPENIMLTGAGKVKVADFGLAKIVEGSQEDTGGGLTAAGMGMGTPNYMSPEQFMDASKVDHRADIFSLGATLYHMLMGTRPYEGETIFQIVRKVEVEEPTPLPETVPPGVRMLVSRLMARKASDRLQTYDEVIRAIDQVKTMLAGAAAAQTVNAIRVPAAARPGSTAPTIPASPGGAPRPAPVQAGTPPPASVGAQKPSTTMPTLTQQPLVPSGGSKTGLLIGLLVGAAAFIGLLVFMLTKGGTPVDEKPPLNKPTAKEPTPKQPPPPSAPSAEQTLAVEARSFVEDLQQAMGEKRYADIIKSVQKVGSKYGKTRFGRKIAELKDEATKLLGTEARAFFAAQEAALGQKNYKEVIDAIVEAGGVYDETIFGEDIKGLKTAAVAGRDEAFKAHVSQADQAEQRGDLDETIRQFDLALKLKDDPQIRQRKKKLRAERYKSLLVDETLAAAARLSSAGKTAEALEKLRAVQKLAGDYKKGAIAQFIADLASRSKVDRALGQVRRDYEAGRYLPAWAGIVQARQKFKDARADQLAREILAKLAPPDRRTGPLGLEFALIKGGTFMMGNAAGDPEEQPVHRVTVSHFYVGRFEVTQGQYAAFKAGTDQVNARTRDARLPQVNVTYAEAVAFCGYLSKRDPGANYRLPTEAEWEFAARGAQNRDYPWGNAAPSRRIANLDGKALAPVGTFSAGATPEGVLDLIGNAAEWVVDWFGSYPAQDQTDPTGPRTGDKRVVRGSAYAYTVTEWSRSTQRLPVESNGADDVLGFRVVRQLKPDERKFYDLKEKGE